jgi:hypothetical protein
VGIEGHCAYVNLKGQVLRVDALVAGAFLPLPAGAPQMQLVHLDGDCHNHPASNLRWMLPADKRRHDADPTRSAATVYKHCPLPAVHELLLQQARLSPPAQQLGALDPEAETWVELEAHRNPRGLCPSVSSWDSYRAAGKQSAHSWRAGQPRAVSLNGRKLDLDRLLASAFVPRTCALADQLVHLGGDDSNCRADQLAWLLQPRRAPRVRSTRHWRLPSRSAAPPTTAARRARPNHPRPSMSRPAARSICSGRARARWIY